MKITLREYTLRWRKRPACASFTDCNKFSTLIFLSVENFRNDVVF